MKPDVVHPGARELPRQAKTRPEPSVFVALKFSRMVGERQEIHEACGRRGEANVNYRLGSVKRAIMAGALLIVSIAPAVATGVPSVHVGILSNVDRLAYPAELEAAALLPQTFGDRSGAAASSPTAPSAAAFMHGTKRICNADTVTVRSSPGGEKLYTLRRGQIFEVTNKRDGVWLYGFGSRGYGYVLGQYLCNP